MFFVVNVLDDTKSGLDPLTWNYMGMMCLNSYFLENKEPAGNYPNLLIIKYSPGWSKRLRGKIRRATAVRPRQWVSIWWRCFIQLKQLKASQ